MSRFKVVLSCTAALLVGIVPSLWAADLPAGLVLQLDAGQQSSVHRSDGVVDRWDNLVPGLSDGLLGDGAKRPRYIEREGVPARSTIQFDGVNDVLLAPAFGVRTETWTLFVVAAPHGPSGSGAFASATALGGHDFDPGFTVDLYQSGAKFDCVSVEGAGRIGGQQDQMQAAYDYGTLHMLMVERAPESIGLRIDGFPEGTRPVSPATTVMDALRIGARFYEDMERGYFKGEIAQVLLFNRILTPAERDQVERKLFVSSAEREERQQAWLHAEAERKANRMRPPVVVKTWPSMEAYLEDQPEHGVGTPQRSLSELPVRTDIREAIALTMTHLVSLFDADLNDEPFFYSNGRADGMGEMHHSLEIGIPHVVGRCLLGIVAGEEATGIPASPEGLSILERYCQQSFDNPYKLNAYLNPKLDNAPAIEFHNMREGLYGLWALIQEKDSPWAKEAAIQMVDALREITGEGDVWTAKAVEQHIPAGYYGGNSVPNAARLVDALLAYYTVSGNEAALRLAGIYARVGLATLFEADGRFAPMDRSSGHVHSITSALSGITAYALQTKDQAMVEQCIRVMEHGVPQYHSSWGWGDEVFPEHPANLVGRGEINQTGDVIRTALLLGDSGRPEYYEMAERWLRSMLLPTQYHEADLRAFLHDNPNPQRDGERDVIQRSIGGFSMQFPNDRRREGDWPISTLDISSGAVHALSECYRHRVTGDGETSNVNLLFDYEGPDVTIDSALPLEGRIAFTFGKATNLAIRIPDWVAPNTLHVEVEGAGRVIHIESGYLKVEGQAGQSGRLTFTLPCKQEKETVDETEYTTTWIGNQIVDIQPRGSVSPLPF